MRHGMQQATLENNGATPASLYQTGLVVQAGKTYHFHGQLKSGGIGAFAGPDGTVTVGLYEGASLDKAIVTCEVKIRSSWAGYTCDLPVGPYAGRATFAISVPSRQNLHADALSLMPADNVRGWRADVLTELKRANVGLIRFPGGCFASTYSWRDGVGPELERMPRTSYAWNDLEYNDVGTAEFVTFCKLIRSEPFLCVNVMTGHPEDAADWVAYCNAPTNTPYGAMRARHGFPEPFKVKYWELDNEDFRKYSPEEYAARAVEFSRLMKAVDPTIKLALCGYWDLVPGFRKELAGMLEIAGLDIDLVARREFGGGMQDTMKLLDTYNRKTGRDLRLCNTEYYPEGRAVPYVDSSEHREPLPSEKNYQHQLIRWGWGLNVARSLFNFRMLGGNVEFTCFNNLANTWGQNIIECPKEGAFLSANGRVFEFLSRSPARWPVRVETKGNLTDGTGIWACLTENKQGVVVSFLNELETPWHTDLDLSSLKLPAGRTAKLMSLSAPDRTSRLTLTTQDVIKRIEQDVPINADGVTAVEVPPCSITELVFE